MAAVHGVLTIMPRAGTAEIGRPYRVLPMLLTLPT
jgi:hypothetical protein